MKNIKYRRKMPKHTPIKFETSFDPKLHKLLLQSIRESKYAKNALNATLTLAALGGILSLGVLAPNALSGISKIFDLTGKEQRRRYNYLWRGFHELRRSQSFEFIEEKGGYNVFRPTFLGKKKIKR